MTLSASADRVVAGLVGDRYEITGLIAEGGMGTVYRARDTVLDRTVALKVLKAGDGDAEFAAHFKTEATNAARLSHPNIVQVYDFGSSDGRPYMAMEFVDGQSLREILASQRVLRPDVAARIAGQVANALEHARRAGIVHRDVKPENILVTTDGQVKMADFGLSRALAESKATQAGVLMGTAHYLAPEQVEGLSADHRADIYSLGIVLYEMLTGRTPFSGDTPVVVAYKRVAEDVPSVMAINPSVPRELDEVVARATARAPQERFATAGEMVMALRAVTPSFDTGELGTLVHHTEAIPIIGHETVAVPRLGQRVQKRRRKRRRLVALAVALTLIGSAVYAGSTRLVKIEVPGVIGLSQKQATDLLKQRGFEVDATFQNSATVEAQEVFDQEPRPGRDIAKGSLVTIVVSLGPKVLSVPDVVGMRFATAEAKLKAEGFVVRREDVFDEKAKKLTVVRQDPSEGAGVVEGSKVTLYVSKGPELVAVPDVVGDPEESAAEDLQQLGFEVKVTHKVNEKVAQGVVISQTPKPGAKIAKGSTVELVVSKGPPLAEVPNVICKRKGKATDMLVAAGFKVEYEDSGPIVVDQQPLPGAKIAKGSTILVTLGSGAICG